MNKKIVFLVAIAVLLLSVPATVMAQQDTTQRIDNIQPNENGDAMWSVEIREPLENQSEVDDFESYVSQVDSSENNQTTQEFQDRFSSVINNADGEYERNMSLDSLTLSAETANTATGDFGITTVEFTWSNYAGVNEQGNLVMGQILSDGYTLSEGERLIITPPEDYEAQDTPVSAEKTVQGNLEWSGPYSFSNTELVFQESTSTDLPLIPIGGGVGVVILIVISVLFMKSRTANSEDKNDSTWNTDELKTEGEKIVEILESNNGRIKQKEVASELDWSDSKVSRVTSSLEEKGVIEKLTIGRENVLDLKEDKKK
jgi:uncharacterized membrane protein